MTENFLRIPPFPGHRAKPIAIRDTSADALDPVEANDLIRSLRRHRVGSSYWAAQPELPAARDLLLAPCSTAQCRSMIDQAMAEGVADRCILLLPPGNPAGGNLTHLPKLERPIDPWFLIQSVTEIWGSADDELALVSALSGKPNRLFGNGRFEKCNDGDESLARAVAQTVGKGLAYRCPFSGEAISPREAVELLGEWRRLIDSNRSFAAVAGVAHWKRPTVDPLLWNGSRQPPHIRQWAEAGQTTSTVIVWKSRTGAALLDGLNGSSANLAEIEDGMIRGPGLGANCVPPLSIVIDRLGVYFDPSAPSELEQILETAEMDSALVERAARLRERIIAAGISKYGATSDEQRNEGSGRSAVLIIGQVEDDRSVLSGGAGQTNLELLVRARALEPDPWIIYRPHPDVEAGHRKGHVPDDIALRYADEIDRTSSIAALIDRVDALQCITSLAGFEALLRGKKVTTHGVPFYAGWGMTHDLADIPARRTRVRTIDELVAATLILYPRYLDPVTRLPCPPEVLVDRIAKGEASVAAPLSGVRRLQGKLKLALRGMLRNAA